MTEAMKGKTAIVTGGSRGIGFAAATALHAAGANVVLTSRSQDDAVHAASALGERALGMGAHVADQAAARACVDEAMRTYGSVDVLVNNAGTNAAHGPVLQQDYARFAKTMDVNLWAPILWSSLVVDAWMGQHGGSIVNTASIGGYSVSHGIGVYNVSKAALIHLTKQLAIELGPAVRVNAVAPGVVRTKLAEALWSEHEEALNSKTPLRRIGEPQDVSSAIMFLASNESSWITGETLVVDGGQVIDAGPPPERGLVPRASGAAANG
ncbi:SDR family oxidoreductase [Aeromicrobium sp.]|uniref:SDR family oxidoreductase n=1 Tax=Aeromicrobium sp. TaxID=1871063 RepID=UPI002FCBE8DC